MKDLKLKIISIIELINIREEFDKKLKSISKEIKSNRIDDLIELCKRKIDKPDRIKIPKEKYREFRTYDWDGLCRYIIFNIIFEHKEKAISSLLLNLKNEERSISGNSMVQLCKIASEGKKQEYILRQILNQINIISQLTETMLIQGLIPITNNSIVDKIYEAVIEKNIANENSTYDIAHICRSIRFWSKSNKIKPKKYLYYLKEVLNGKSDDYYEKELKKFPVDFVDKRIESIKINSAIIHYQIQDDELIIEKMKDWKKNSKFEANKRRIEDWIQQSIAKTK